MNRRLGGFQSWSDVLEERKIPSLCLLDIVWRIETYQCSLVPTYILEAVVLSNNTDFCVIDIYIYINVCNLELFEGEFAVMGTQNVKPSVRKPRTRWKNNTPMKFRCQWLYNLLNKRNIVSRRLTPRGAQDIAVLKNVDILLPICCSGISTYACVSCNFIRMRCICNSYFQFQRKVIHRNYNVGGSEMGNVSWDRCSHKHNAKMGGVVPYSMFWPKNNLWKIYKKNT